MIQQSAEADPIGFYALLAIVFLLLCVVAMGVHVAVLRLKEWFAGRQR